jgi:Zn-dependent M32 family carboxypeptidase
VDFLTKPIIGSQGLSRLLDMLIQSYQDEDHINSEELVKNLTKENVLWTSQAYDILQVFKNSNDFSHVAPYLLNRIVDRHNRFHLVAHFENS